jgi:hypothetical protein
VLVGALLIALGLALSLAGARLKDRWGRSGGLLVTLTGFFIVFAVGQWKADAGSPGLSVGLLFGAAGIFQLLTWFEPGPPTP